MPRLAPRAILRVALLLLALLWVPWVVAWAVDLEGRSWLIPSAAAFLPYALGATVIVAVLAALARARAALVVAVIGILVLAVPRIGRATSDPQPAAAGTTLTVATANVYIGKSDPDRLARLAAEHGVDVFAIQENTRRWDAAMETSELARRFPYRRSVPGREGHAEGLAVLSRWPIDSAAALSGDWRSLGVLVQVPGNGNAATPVQVRSVHPFPPFSNENLDCWRRCTRALTQAAQLAPATILAGDWNATLDHHPIRHVLAAGYRDAAEEAGLGWRPTWSNGSWGGLTIDHVLVTRGIAVQGVTAHDQPPSDHDVVVARLRLPR